MVKSYLSRSCYIASNSSLQLQPRLPGASRRHWCCPACSRANAFCHSPLKTRIAGASHQIDQLSRSLLIGTIRVFNDFHVKSRFRYSLVHIFPTSSSKSAPNASVLYFVQFWSANRSLASVLCAFCHLIFRNCPANAIFKHFELQIALSPLSCALFVGDFPRSRPATPETEILYTSATTEKPLYNWKNRVSFPRAFSPAIHTLPTCYTSQLLDDDDDDDGDGDGDGDDVVDMMMGWTWWCGWHDDVVDMWWEC